MYKYCICILYCYFTRFPDGQCREKQKGGGTKRLVQLYIQYKWWRREEGTVPGFVHREEHVVSDQPRSDWKEETGGREGEQRGRGRTSASPPTQFVLFCWVVFSWSAGLFACWVVKCS